MYSNNRVKLNLHKCKTVGMNQFNIDKLSDDDFDEEEDEIEEQSSESDLDLDDDEDEFSESGTESFPDTESTGPSEATTESSIQIDRMRAPMLGMNAHSRRMSLDAKIKRDMHRPILGNNKNIFQSYDDISIDDSSQLYSRIERRRESSENHYPTSSSSSSNRFRVPKQPKSKGLTMIEELSPIRSDSLGDVPPPMPPSLRSKSEWNPQLTSTTTSFQPLIPLIPKTNPRVGHHPISHNTQHQKFISSTPRMTLTENNKNYQQHHHRSNKKSHRNLYSRLEKTDSLTGESDYYESPIPWSQPANLHPMNNPAFCRAEHYGLPSALAKNLGINGIVFLTMSLCGRRLTVNIQKGVYFRDSSQSNICSYVRAELRNRSKSHQMPKRSRASSSNGGRYEETYRTRLVPTTNRPTFQETFQFKLSENCGRDYLALTVYSMEADEPQKKKVLGCMAFPISRLLKKARQANADYFYYQPENENVEEVEINNDGYFLLDPKYGEKRNLPQSKVKRQTYYNDPTLSGTSGSSFNSQGKMTATSSRLSVPNDLTMGDYYCSSSDVRVRANPNHNLDYTSASSSTNESSSAAGAAQVKFHRATLPSITTTTSENTSDEAAEERSERAVNVDHHYLYAENGGVYGAGPLRDESPKRPSSSSPGVSVRRAASFTFSPKGTAAKNNQRPAALLRTEEEKEKRKFL
ncbi:unnamed protein product [Caenorhabditis angaria]|uniref:C2 domain-containing protein n=1 Tax=Caenorhabditis angaria TaxID=860376 RepID=A0A9P1J118_9PELO|nr:unnamed protein product [Caenorhabditis angaria]